MNAEQIMNAGKNFAAGQLNWLLIITIGIILFYMIKGGAEGFIRTVFEMFSVLVAAAAASFLAPYINKILKVDAPLFSFLIGYFIVWLVLKYTCVVLDIMAKLPIINEFNKATGILAGLVRGVFMVWILFIIITVFRETQMGGNAMEMIMENRILEQLYQGNLIYKLARLFF